jgi:hypothetical protein
MNKIEIVTSVGFSFHMCAVVDIELPLHWRSICLLEEW